MEDEEDNNSELIKIVDLLIQVRSTKIDRLNRVYRESVKAYEQSYMKWEEARDDFTGTLAESEVKKISMQGEMMKCATDIREITSWLNKEKELDKLADEKKTFMQAAKSIQNDKEKDSKELKKQYLAAEKKLEKMKIFKGELNVN